MSEVYYSMASQSKEESVLKLILENSPYKQWHFEEIVKSSNVTRAVASKWLKKYASSGLVRRVREEGRFPYYIVGEKNIVYYSLKRLYALEQVYNSGLIQGLLQIKKSKTIILFGSWIKGDWYKESDIDLFIFGSVEGFDKKVYEQKLNRNLELHVFKDKESISAIKTGLIKNVVNGYLVKGQIQDILEVN